jgi:hypothetical protein
MKVLDPIDRFGLHDGQPVDEMLGRDQSTIQEQCMSRRQPQIMHGDPCRQRPGAHHNGQHLALAGNEPPGIGTPPNPLNWPRIAGNRHDLVTNGEIFDRDLAARRQDQRPAAITGWLAEVGTGKVGTGKVGTGKVGTGKVGTGKVGTGKVGTGKVGTGKVGTGKVGTGKVGTGEVGTGKVGTGKVGTGKVGTGGIICRFHRVHSRALYLAKRHMLIACVLSVGGSNSN